MAKNLVVWVRLCLTDQKGFMLMDILISISLLTLTLTSILPLYLYAYISLRNSAYALTAITIMNEQIEALKMLDFEKITDRNDPRKGEIVQRCHYDFNQTSTFYEKKKNVEKVHEFLIQVKVLYDPINTPNTKDIIISVIWHTIGGKTMKVDNFFQITPY